VTVGAFGVVLVVIALLRVIGMVVTQGELCGLLLVLTLLVVVVVGCVMRHHPAR
jgi:hypothetical protein